MNSNENKLRVVNEVVAGAERRDAEKNADTDNIQMKFSEGEVFLSVKGIITMLTLNSKRKSLNKNQVEIFNRMIKVFHEYQNQGIAQMTSLFNFYSGQKIIYIGGQLDNERPKLEQGKEYTTFHTCNGLIGSKWVPVVSLEEFPGETEDTRPGFAVEMFIKKPKAEKIDDSLKVMITE